MARILIVDDDPDGSEAVALFLARFGHQVECVPNGHKAMIALVTDRPDVLIADVQMPQMDGLMLLKVMRSYLRFADVVAMLMTAHATPQQIAEARELGVEHVFHKANYRFEDLATAVAAVAGGTAEAPAAN